MKRPNRDDFIDLKPLANKRYASALDEYIDYLESTRLPDSLTAENGDKDYLRGEFVETYWTYADPYGEFEEKLYVSWDNIKAIYRRIIRKYR